MFDSKLITGKLNRWGRFMKRFSLPEYDEIPNLGLYMDQVLTLMNQYLAPLRTGESEEFCVTPATINNYVRVKIMPAPEKKKYYRLHIAYLIIICTLKQSISISDIQSLVPFGLNEEEMSTLYQDYIQCYKASVLFFMNEVRSETERILSTGALLLEEEQKAKKLKASQTPEGEEDKAASEKAEEPSEGQKEFDHAVKTLLFSAATIASFSELLTSKIIGLRDVEYTDEAVADRLV